MAAVSILIAVLLLVGFRSNLGSCITHSEKKDARSVANAKMFQLK